MECFIFATMVPSAVDVGVGTGVAFLATLVACVPLAVVLRHALSPRETVLDAPQLRVIEGGKELSRRAA